MFGFKKRLKHLDVQTTLTAVNHIAKIKDGSVRNVKTFSACDMDSCTLHVVRGRNSKSDIYINVYDVLKFGDKTVLPDHIVAKMITTCFHERRHAYQNMMMDSYSQKEKMDREIAAMGIVCEFFPHMYKAAYWTDVREYDAEINGIKMARDYCKQHFPDFDYDSAMLEHARSDPYAIIRGNFKTFDEMMDTAIDMRDNVYGMTRKRPERKVHGKTVETEFIARYAASETNSEYSRMDGYEQVVKMFDMLDESGILKGKEHAHLAFYYRYDKQLQVEHEGLDIEIPTMGMRPGSARAKNDKLAEEHRQAQERGPDMDHGLK